MPHIALLCPPLPGHLNPMAVLGRSLQRRGYTVSFFGLPAIESSVRAQGLDFVPLGTAGSDSLSNRIRMMGQLEGLRSLRFAVESSRQIADLLCRELPDALARTNVDLMLVDQNEPAAGTVAQHVRLPFINVCPSLPLNREPDIPPPFVPWQFKTSALSRLRNKIGYAASDFLIAAIHETINRYRKNWHLPELRQPDDSFSDLAQLCQMTADFDFPRRQLPATFYYLGPFVDANPLSASFPFDRLDGRPLVFASLGTLQDKDSGLFATIAKACAGLDVQLVIALGGTNRSTNVQFPGNPIVVGFVPQLEILTRASLAITHAGLNTVMQALMFGVPILALPITHDQPAIAARVARSGAGEAIAASNVDAEFLRSAIRRVLSQTSYRERAQHISCSIRSAGGVERGADIVESVMAKHCAPCHAFRNY